MATLSRARPRNVFFADLRDPEVDLGGLLATTGTTNAIFHTIIDIALQVSPTFTIQYSDGAIVPRDDMQLLPGRYLIVSDDEILPSPQTYYTRALSGTTGTRLHSFRKQVRERDGRCVITKLQAVGREYDYWVGHEAAHVVPLAHSAEWRTRGFSNLVTHPPPHPHQNDLQNSVQNGLLMESTVHQLFDSYNFSILPEAGYKIIVFQPDIRGLAGTSLDRQLLDDDRRPPDAFLRWHFEQAVLCNVRGAGEPSFEFDFPPGSDMVGEILRAPKAAERMEFELFTRLGASRILPESTE